MLVDTLQKVVKSEPFSGEKMVSYHHLTVYYWHEVYYMTVVTAIPFNETLVYCNGVFSYEIKCPNEKFYQDLRDSWLLPAKYCNEGRDYEEFPVI